MTSPRAADHTEFTHVLLSGAIVGVVTAVLVIVYLLVARLLSPGIVPSLLEAILVLAGGVAAAFLPASFTSARTTQGIAGAAAIGLWGTIVFMAIDIIILRPVHAYPWTWDAIGGGSSWWYLPCWWMLGTFLAWMGGIVTTGRAARSGDVGLAALALPVVVGAAILALVASLLHLGIYLPVAAGGGFAVVLIVLALLALRPVAARG